MGAFTLALNLKSALVERCEHWRESFGCANFRYWKCAPCFFILPKANCCSQSSNLIESEQLPSIVDLKLCACVWERERQCADNWTAVLSSGSDTVERGSLAGERGREQWLNSYQSFQTPLKERRRRKALWAGFLWGFSSDEVQRARWPHRHDLLP